MEFVGQDLRTYTRVLKIKESDKNFTATIAGESHTYTLMRDRIYRSGRERLPKAYYRIGKDLPRDMLSENPGAISSVRYREIAKQKIMADLLAAFKKQTVDNMTMLLIIVFVSLIGFLAIGIFINTKFDELFEVLRTNPVILQ
jgi:hypothetical protein